MKRDKELPLLREDEPMTEEDLGSWRKVGFDEIDLIAPSIRKVIEHHMPDLVERLPPEGTSSFRCSGGSEPRPSDRR